MFLEIMTPWHLANLFFSSFFSFLFLSLERLNSITGAVPLATLALALCTISIGAETFAL